MDMRRKYKSQPTLSSAQLATYWIARMNARMAALTQNRGKAGREGSINPTNTPPRNTYNPGCGQ